ncbi:MAG: ATP-binding cassette domain-containing protein [Desulfobacterales bacterium]
MQSEPLKIELRDIHKHYGAVRANDGVNLIIEAGSIHGILGENGAGKSTLMKILSGYIPRSSGTILANGRPADYGTPAGASALGIGMLYQDPLDFPQLSVLDNFMLGQIRGLRDRRGEFALKLRELADYAGFDLDPQASVSRLTVGERQQLEILRLLSLGTKMLILDEPTTGISALQKESLFRALKKLAAEGTSVVLVSHKLEDVDILCDRITVLRQGRVAGHADAPFDTRQVLEMMFGTPPMPPAKCRTEPGAQLLVMKEVSASGGRTGLRNCSICVCESEIIGLAGLEGSGQGVFLRVAAGLISPSSGTVQIRGKNMNRKDHQAFKKEKISFLPTDRLEEGLIGGLSLTEHFALTNRGKFFLVGWVEAFRKAVKNIEYFRIKGKPESRADALSGGNQQRLLLSFLPEDSRLLLLENPTRGLDLESALWVWTHLQTYCERKTAIVFSSPELDEILMMADRVLVFFDGQMIKDVRTQDTDINELGRAIAGKI